MVESEQEKSRINFFMHCKTKELNITSFHELSDYDNQQKIHLKILY